MESERITPHKVTKPIQLLAAWLVGLCVIDGAFLATATSLSSGGLQVTLVIAAIINVPLFIVAIFLLQTKIRPEMQEDVYYAQYLDKKTNKPTEITFADMSVRSFEKIGADVRAIANTISGDSGELGTKEPLKFRFGIAINDYLPWFSDLKKDMRAGEFEVTDVFGKINKTEQPEKFVISIDRQAHGPSIRALLRVLLKYNFDGIEITDSFNQPDPSDVYIGGYGYERGYALITEELKNIVESDFDFVDLQRYVTFNKIVIEEVN